MAEAEAATAEAVPADQSPFVKELVKVWRAQDTHGAWEGKKDLDLRLTHLHGVNVVGNHTRGARAADGGHVENRTIL